MIVLQLYERGLIFQLFQRGLIFTIIWEKTNIQLYKRGLFLQIYEKWQICNYKDCFYNYMRKNWFTIIWERIGFTIVWERFDLQLLVYERGLLYSYMREDFCLPLYMRGLFYTIKNNVFSFLYSWYRPPALHTQNTSIQYMKNNWCVHKKYIRQHVHR